ncbi:hypothetical protein DL96DRAFT_1705700 [Flagelloscypha sp. PMI_526]|nr:hypothetical protein DL96DRAFT_1705700 [Flagelloscypha sp. PMI_526]
MKTESEYMLMDIATLISDKDVMTIIDEEPDDSPMLSMLVQGKSSGHLLLMTKIRERLASMQEDETPRKPCRFIENIPSRVSSAAPSTAPSLSIMPDISVLTRTGSQTSPLFLGSFSGSTQASPTSPSMDISSSAAEDLVGKKRKHDDSEDEEEEVKEPVTAAGGQRLVCDTCKKSPVLTKTCNASKSRTSTAALSSKVRPARNDMLPPRPKKTPAPRRRTHLDLHVIGQPFGDLLDIIASLQARVAELEHETSVLSNQWRRWANEERQRRRDDGEEDVSEDDIVDPEEDDEERDDPATYEQGDLKGKKRAKEQ